MTRKLILAAFLLTVVLTVVAAHHQLTNAAPNMAPPPKHAPPIEQYAARLDPQTMVPPGPTWHVVAGGGGKDADLRDISMATPTEGWAVGSTSPGSFGAMFMYYTNTTWSRASVTTGTYSLQAVSMIGPTEGWATGSVICSSSPYYCDQGLLMHYTADDGWHVTPTGGYWLGLNAMDIKGTAGWIVGYGDDGHFLQFNGTSWTPVVAPTSIDYYSGVSVVDANEAWAVGGNKLAHFLGGSWSIVSPGLSTNTDLRGIHMQSASAGWAVGYRRLGSLSYTYQCVALHYDGTAWSQVSCPGDTRLRSVRMRSSTDVWAVGFNGAILHYDGSAWSQATSPTRASLSSVKLVGADDGWIVGADGTILRLVSGSWTLVQGSTLPMTVGPLDAASTNEAWFGGDSGQLYRWKDGIITTHASPVATSITALDMVSPTLGWAATAPYSLSILRYSDGVWTTYTTDSSVSAISMVSPDEGWFANGGILHYHSGVWESQRILGLSVDSISMLDSSHGWAIGQDYFSDEWKAYAYTDGTWNVVTLTTVITGDWGVLKITGVSPSEAWVAGYTVICTPTACPVSPHLYHFSEGAWSSGPMSDWLAFYSFSKVNMTEWWATGKRATGEYAFLHYKDGNYTIVPSAREDIQQVSMLPDGSGFAAGVGSLLWLHEYPYSVYLSLVIRQ